MPVHKFRNTTYSKITVCEFCNQYNEDPLLIAKNHRVPFYCEECGRIKFPYKAKWDYVFIWPIPMPETFVDGGEIVRPDNTDNPEDEVYGRSGEGVVLSFGPGYYDKRNKFHPSTGLKVGMKVYYDKGVPPRVHVRGVDGKNYVVVICGYRDVKGEIVE